MDGSFWLKIQFLAQKLKKFNMVFNIFICWHIAFILTVLVPACKEDTFLTKLTNGGYFWVKILVFGSKVKKL